MLGQALLLLGQALVLLGQALVLLGQALVLLGQALLQRHDLRLQLGDDRVAFPAPWTLRPVHVLVIGLPGSKPLAHLDRGVNGYD